MSPYTCYGGLCTGIVGNEKANVGIVQHRSDANQPGTTTRNNRNVLPCILAGLALAMVLIVEMGNGLSQGLDTGSRSILAAVEGDVNGLGPLEAALDLILYLNVVLVTWVFLVVDVVVKDLPQGHPL